MGVGMLESTCGIDRSADTLHHVTKSAFGHSEGECSVQTQGTKPISEHEGVPSWPPDGAQSWHRVQHLTDDGGWKWVTGG